MPFTLITSILIDRSHSHRFIIIGMVKNLYTMFISLNLLFESDRGSWYLWIIQVVFSKKIRVSFESGNIIPLLIVVPTHPFDLILELPIINI